jgi:hypothetical protein
MHLICVYCEIDFEALAYADCSEPGTALPERHCFGE